VPAITRIGRETSLLQFDSGRWVFGVRRFLLSVRPKNKTALLIVAHGSTVNKDSSAPTLANATEIRRRNIFAQVECAFWKEEPSLRDAIFLFEPESIREVYVVPNFISEGYFTQTVVPRELELNGRVTTRSNGQVWKYCDPVGNHPMMTELLLQRASDIAPGADPSETSLLIVAHGTDLNENSAVAAKREADRIRTLGKYAVVLNAYMEEPPLISEWRKLTRTPNVVVVPFFISDGLHSYEDIPALLGIAVAAGADRGRSDLTTNHGQIFRRNPYKIDGRSLFYASSIGTDPGFADIIIEQVLSAKT
jgi:sirohydrochlorin cobaltochelatase